MLRCSNTSANDTRLTVCNIAEKYFARGNSRRHGVSAAARKLRTAQINFLGLRAVNLTLQQQRTASACGNFFFRVNIASQRKGKPVVRRGRKASGLCSLERKIAGLPANNIVCREHERRRRSVSFR
jgi:hypothetical protein